MNIEELTKSQIILLTLLVSFMTSIATGIVTVSLLDQAPPAITQNINRVVERTVERVVPADSQNASAGGATTVTETTVVVKESDLITESIDKNAQSLVRVYARGSSSNEPGQFLGLGFFITRGGLIVTDGTLVSSGTRYVVRANDGTTYGALVQDAGEGKATALLRVDVADAGNTTFAPVAFSQDLLVLKLGQTVISLSGNERTNVSIGIISAIDTATSGEGEEATTAVSGVRTDIGQARIVLGSPLIDLFGEVVGIHTAQAQGTDSVAGFTPVSSVRTQMAQFVETE